MNIRKRLFVIVFGTETRAGKRFDLALLYVILFSVAIVMLESVPEIGQQYGNIFSLLEWSLTIIFSIEYLLRIWVSPKPSKYIFSFWGMIDFLSIVPTYLTLFMTGYQYLLMIRIFRLLRVFRILKLARFNHESQVLINALRRSAYKIGIFLVVVVALVTFMGTIMYVVEGGKEGFTSIPQSIYWAIVTVTTVGYGDMVPHTVLGKFISSIAMILGYAIIAVPTGIVTVAMATATADKIACTNCNQLNDTEAKYCTACGKSISQVIL